MNPGNVIEVVPNSNPCSPQEEFVVEIPLDAETPLDAEVQLDGKVPLSAAVYFPEEGQSPEETAQVEHVPQVEQITPPEEVPPANNYFEIDTVEEESSESDLSSYDFNYDSDSGHCSNHHRANIFPTIPLSNYLHDQNNAQDETNWIKLDEDDIWCVPPIPLLRPGGQLNIISSG